MTFTIQLIQKSDWPEWHSLWHAYLEFYHTKLSEDQFTNTFTRITTSTASAQSSAEGSTPDDICGVILRDEQGKAQGLAHYLFHRNTWTPKYHCYLNDLYVSPGCRGKGYGKALIRAVEQESKDHGSVRLYWTTAPDNTTARRLYDSLATMNRVAYRIDH